MSWEIQGKVSTAADVDALVAAPTESPASHESAQVDAVQNALKDLIGAGAVGAPLTIRAGGHANKDGGPAEGQPFEMITITVEYDPSPQLVVAAPAEPEVDEVEVDDEVEPDLTPDEA